MNEPLAQVEQFARDLQLPARHPNEREEAFRSRVGREANAILIQSVVATVNGWCDKMPVLKR